MMPSLPSFAGNGNQPLSLSIPIISGKDYGLIGAFVYFVSMSVTRMFQEFLGFSNFFSAIVISAPKLSERVTFFE